MRRSFGKTTNVCKCKGIRPARAGWPRPADGAACATGAGCAFLPGLLRQPGPEFIQIREVPLCRVFTRGDAVVAVGGGQVHGFGRDAQVGLGGEEHLDLRRHQGGGVLLDHHAQAPRFEAHQRANGVDAQAFHEGLEQPRVQVPACPLGHAADGFGRIPAILVRAVGGDGVVHIADGGHARDGAELVVAQAVGVARAIGLLVVVQAGVQHGRLHATALAQHLPAFHGVGLDQREFLVGELARLVEHGQGDGGLAEIVQQPGQAGGAHLALVQPDLAAQRHHQRAHGHGVHVGVVVGGLQPRQADERAGVAQHRVGDLLHQAGCRGHVHCLAHAGFLEHRDHGLLGVAADLRGAPDFHLGAGGAQVALGRGGNSGETTCSGGMASSALKSVAMRSSTSSGDRAGLPAATSLPRETSIQTSCTAVL